MHLNLRFSLITVVTLMPLLVTVPVAAASVDVTDAGDSGSNTLRFGIDLANTNRQIDHIHIGVGLKEIELQTSVTYTGTQELTIDGAGATITSDGARNLLVANGGGNLHLESISFTAALKSGIVVSVPPGHAARQQVVSLTDVVLKDNGHHGLHFDDKIGNDGGSRMCTSLSTKFRLKWYSHNQSALSIMNRTISLRV